ncbi:LysR family transcriptional regulator [Photobacterium minamisatsumaniensis]|uniref:LysR family transcriptional regulator n=1 Tax=Photobacterium minamisatsumaniensis TaxID=2910233 RepID=UPI003D0A5DFB
MQTSLLSKLVKKDLNLLVYLTVLLEQRHVSRAAEILGVSQATMSYYLQKLRVEFNDSLLIKSKQGMVLSPLGEQLVVPLNQLLRQLDSDVYQRNFNPALAEGVIRFCTQDATLLHLLPALINDVAKRAPHLCLEFLDWPKDIFSSLESGDIDLALGGLDEVPPSVHGKCYFQSQFSAIVSKQHPLAKLIQPSLEDVIDYPQIRISPGAVGEMMLDEIIRRKGLQRRVTLRTSSFNIALESVRQGHHVAFFNRLVVESCAASPEDFHIIEIQELPAPEIYLYWNTRVHREPAQIWFREQLTRLIQDGFERLGVKTIS